MLTATYSLVTISTEQESARNGLAELQQYVRRTWRGVDRIDFALLEQSLNRLTQFDRFIHCRKIEAHLIPALRNADAHTDVLISELGALSAKASGVLCAIDEQLADAFDLGAIQVTEISRLMEQYCHYLSIRLDREDNELLPMATRVFSVEDWFSIAAKFLSGNARGAEIRSQRARPSDVLTVA